MSLDRRSLSSPLIAALFVCAAMTQVCIPAWAYRAFDGTDAARLQHVSRILHVAIAYFFEGSPGQLKAKGDAPSLAYVSDFMATTDGLTLAKTFMQIKNASVRHHIAGARRVHPISGHWPAQTLPPSNR
jgi:hypothetical protein